MRLYKFQQKFRVTNATDFIDKMLNWAEQFGIFLFLNNNGYTQCPPHRFDWLLGAGAGHFRQFTSERPLLSTVDFEEELSPPIWLGHIAYDYKNFLEKSLQTRLSATHEFLPWFFFVPQILLTWSQKEKTCTIACDDANPEEIFSAIQSMTETDVKWIKPAWEKKEEKTDYLKSIQRLKHHIVDGDCYEINYCVEQSAHKNLKKLHVPHLYQNLMRHNHSPFSALYKNGSQYVISATPERFLGGDAKRVFSQPMKGTIARGKSEQDDIILKNKLQNSEKDKAENAMITDLVRSDLAKSCEVGSIHVPRYLEVQTFPKVHQMVSTIEGKIQKGISWAKLIENAFPMGSMTGAPKVKVMELIDRYERSARGLFSGTLGYVEASGRFDFNVLIRSLFYDAETGVLSFQSGGAITADSHPEAEWEELLLKGKVFSEILYPLRKY